MKILNTAQFPNFLKLLGHLWVDGAFGGGDLNIETKRETDKTLSDLEQQCLALGLDASRATVQRMREGLINPESMFSNISKLSLELQGRLIDELSGQYCLVLSTRESDLYHHPWKGWEPIIDRFPNAVSDIEEMSKCFGLSRYPASVFHSVQVIEHGLIELGKWLNVNDPISGWTAVSNELKRITTKKHQDRNDFERMHFSFIEQMQGTVESMKNAWRNKISHAHGRLGLLSAEFSPDVAEEIMSATKAFMRRLAIELPAGP